MQGRVTRRRRHRRVLAATVLAVIAAMVVVVVAAPLARDRLRPAERSSAPPSTRPTRHAQIDDQPGPLPASLTARPVTLSQATTFVSWALLDPATGAISGSANLETGANTTESMIKPWIAADYLRIVWQHHLSPSPLALSELTRMILDSDDNLAEKYYDADGYDAVVKRLITMCHLRHTTSVSGWWSQTRMTAADGVRYAQCVANGTAAGPQWTAWLLAVMRRVRGGVDDQQATTGGGRWGIIDALPPDLARQTAIKNGWTPMGDGMWHVDCLAINPAFDLVVMVRYRVGYGLAYGDAVCQSVTRQLLVYPDF